MATPIRYGLGTDHTPKVSMATPIRYGLGTDHTKGLNDYSYKIWTGDRSHQRSQWLLL